MNPYLDNFSHHSSASHPILPHISWPLLLGSKPSASASAFSASYCRVVFWASHAGGEWGEWEHLGSQDSVLHQNCIWTLEELLQERWTEAACTCLAQWRASVNSDDGLFAGKDQIWKSLSPEWWHHRVICWQLEDEECAQEERWYLQLSLQVQDDFTHMKLAIVKALYYSI